jgi:hypothetical protein
MRLEVLGCRLIATDFHYTQLIPLPYCAPLLALLPLPQNKRYSAHTIQIGRADKGDVHAHIAVVGRAVET